jgi:hypothetical protein
MPFVDHEAQTYEYHICRAWMLHFGILGKGIGRAASKSTSALWPKIELQSTSIKCHNVLYHYELCHSHSNATHRYDMSVMM